MGNDAFMGFYGIYPLVSSNMGGKSPINGGFNGNISHKWWIFQQAMFDYWRVQQISLPIWKSTEDQTKKLCQTATSCAGCHVLLEKSATAIGSAAHELPFRSLTERQYSSGAGCRGFQEIGLYISLTGNCCKLHDTFHRHQDDMRHLHYQFDTINIIPMKSSVRCSNSVVQSMLFYFFFGMFPQKKRAGLW